MKFTAGALEATPLDALRELLKNIDSGEIELRELSLETAAASRGAIQFTFRGVAVATAKATYPTPPEPPPGRFY